MTYTDKMKNCPMHEVIGLSCIHCGWEMKILNLFIPKGKKSSIQFIRRLNEFTPEGTMIREIEGKYLSICEVGFDLGMHQKLYLSQELLRTLEDREVNVPLRVGGYRGCRDEHE